ncbi:MAG: substrate-binding domain-containing protein [Nitrospira sp.]
MNAERKKAATVSRWVLIGVCLLATGCASESAPARHAGTVRDLVVTASPAVADAMIQLGRAFEATQSDVRVRTSVDLSLDLRRTVSAMENRGRSFIGSGPIHFVAPGGDELITRMEQKYYLLPEAKVLYATEQLVLVAPESLSEAPESFEALARMESIRIAVADRSTRLGIETDRVLTALGLQGKQIDVANDTAGVLDHILSGQADVGIVFGQEAVKLQERVRVLAAAPTQLYRPIPHSIAMERYCPDRALCEAFLQFATSPDGQAVLKRLGYGPGKPPAAPVHLYHP